LSFFVLAVKSLPRRRNERTSHGEDIGLKGDVQQFILWTAFKENMLSYRTVSRTYIVCMIYYVSQ